MKFLALFVVISAPLVFGSAVAISADTDKTYKVGDAAVMLDNIENKSDVQKIPEVAFSIQCEPEGLLFVVDFLGKVKVSGKPPNETVELFFKIDEKLSPRRYYQFYGLVSANPRKLKAEYVPIVSALGAPSDGNMEILPFYYDSIIAGFPYLRNYKVAVNADDNASHVKIMIPWSDIQTVLPFDDNGKGKSWRFNVQYSNEHMAWNWQGKLHSPDTWGIIRFSDISEAQLAQIYYSAAMQNLRTPINVEKWLFDANSTPSVRMGLNALQPPEKINCSLSQAKEFAENTRHLTELRSMITSSSYLNKKDSVWKQYSVSSNNGVLSRQELTFGKAGYAVYDDKGKVNGNEARNGYIPRADSKASSGKMLELQYRFEKDYKNGNSVYIMNFSRRYISGQELITELKLNDKTIIAFSQSGYFDPANVELGEIKKGDILSIVYKGTNISAAPNFNDFFTIEEFKSGMKPPRQAIDFANKNIYDKPRPHIDENGQLYAPETGRLISQSIDMLLGEPKLVFLGDAMTDGLGFTDSFKELSKTYSCAEIGTVGSKPFNVLWRVKYGIFGTIKPALVVLNISPSFNDVKASVDAVKAIVDEIRSQSPETKILILSIYPPPKTEKYSPELPFVLQNKALADAFNDGKKVFFTDLTDKFFREDGTLKKELYKPVYFTEDGYKDWLEAAMPYIRKFVPALKENVK